ncbi:MAG: hypothetical protein ACJ8KF_00165 [Chthoniobacterales bacterium]
MKVKGSSMEMKQCAPKWTQSLTAVAFTIATLFAGSLSAQDKNSAAEATNICLQTARDALASCRSAARSDYQVALGKCINISDSTARRSCEEQAAADLADALDTCQGGFEVRQASCQKLGPGRYDPVIDPKNFTTTIDNPYFPLVPGTTFTYLTPNGRIKDVFAVTHHTRVINGVTCVQVHDSVYTNDELTENTLDFFAQDREGNVWYFGENTAELENGLLATIEGSFLSGLNNDKAGIIMKPHPAPGDFYRQEFSLGNAEDYAETLNLNSRVVVPYGRFNDCLKSQETTPLEPDALEDKYYAPGVGNVLTVDRVTGERDELISITTE